MNTIKSTLFKPYAILFIPVYHSVLELLHLIGENSRAISKSVLIGLLTFGLLSNLGYYKLTLWCLKWVGLGILSSIGFGFGMHTFVLFLAPHIAAVTMASHSCKSLNFPEPPYPDEIICPDTIVDHDMLTFSKILFKVSLESFMWGLGTAIGELPPYLAARLRAQAIKSRSQAGGDSIDSNYEAAGWEVWMIRIINKIGFVGILLCAAIPNPLFDAAGVASGIAQVPFISFFGATFIGKAVIKVLIQSSFVVFLFHNNNLDLLIGQVDKRLGEFSSSFRNLKFHNTLTTFLQEQRTNVLRKQINEPKHTSMISTVFNWLICSIMILFIISVINNLDKQYKERKASKVASKID